MFATGTGSASAGRFSSSKLLPFKLTRSALWSGIHDKKYRILSLAYEKERRTIVHSSVISIWNRTHMVAVPERNIPVSNGLSSASRA